jgi:hypothetical protein
MRGAPRNPAAIALLTCPGFSDDRRLTTARRFLREYEASPRGERGALLRREGLYSSHVDAWRKQQATGGRWAALHRYAKQGPRSILVADLDANAIWSIPVENDLVTTVLAVSDTELLLAEGLSTSAQMFDALVRYDLAKLSDYATKLP